MSEYNSINVKDPNYRLPENLEIVYGYDQDDKCEKVVRYSGEATNRFTGKNENDIWPLKRMYKWRPIKSIKP